MAHNTTRSHGGLRNRKPQNDIVTTQFGGQLDNFSPPQSQGEQIRGAIGNLNPKPAIDAAVGGIANSVSSGSPIDLSQFDAVNFGGVSRSPEATQALNQAVAQQQLGTDVAGAYIDPSTGEVRYPSMGWAMQQVPGLEQELNQAKIDEYINSGRQAENYAANWFAPGVSPQQGQAIGSTPQDTLQDTGGGGGGGGGGVSDVAAAFDNYFANQAQFSMDKFGSIANYLDQLQLSSDEGFASDMQRLEGMYASRREDRNERFEKAMSTVNGRETAAMETLAELGVTTDAETFDPVTGESNEFLLSQQLSGADALNSLSYITDTVYDFAKNEQDLSIAAGLENAQQTLLSEMAAIQMAVDGRAISVAEAASASAAAAADAANMQQYWITMGKSMNMSAEDSIAYGQLGMLQDAYATATDPSRPSIETDLGWMTPEQYNQYRKTDLAYSEAANAQGKILMNVGGQNMLMDPRILTTDFAAFMQQQGIPITEAVAEEGP